MRVIYENFLAGTNKLISLLSTQSVRTRVADSESGVVEKKLAVYFAHKNNPNAPKDSISLLRNITWKKWSSSEEKPPLLTFVDPVPSMTITSDTYRSEAMKLVIELSLK